MNPQLINLGGTIYHWKKNFASQPQAPHSPLLVAGSVHQNGLAASGWRRWRRSVPLSARVQFGTRSTELRKLLDRVLTADGGTLW